MKLTSLFGAAVSALFLFACAKLDVVGNDSVRAFGELLEAMPVEAAGNTWSVSAPDGSARFSWNGETAAMAIDARPFIGAGLELSRLDNAENAAILFSLSFPNAGDPASPPSPLEDFRRFVRLGRGSIGYHHGMDHYGISIGDGNVFEWAKDMSANDKDMVFALNPEPFIQAGTNPNAVEGWIFAKITVDGANGKPVEVDKLLKIVNLK